MVRVYAVAIKGGSELDFYLNVPKLQHSPTQHRLSLRFNSDANRYEVYKYTYSTSKSESCYTYPKIEDALRCGARIELDETGISTHYEVVE